MGTIRKLAITSLGLFIFILSINLGFWLLVGMKFEPVDEIYQQGFIIEAKPYAWAFVHGRYVTVYDNVNNTMIYRGTNHYTTYHNKSMPTIGFLDQLYEQGYTHVWGTWCMAGDSPYVYEYYYNKTYSRKYPWPDWVSRNEKPGLTLPIFYGVGFYRYSLPEPVELRFELHKNGTNTGEQYEKNFQYTEK